MFRWCHMASLLTLDAILSVGLILAVEEKVNFKGTYVEEASATVRLFEHILDYEIGAEFPFGNLTFQCDIALAEDANMSSDVINIFWQVEHGILLCGGDCAPNNCIVPETDRHSCYQLRYESERGLADYDLVIEYSHPNIHLLEQQSAQLWRSVLSKILYIPPIPLTPALSVPLVHRTIDCLALYTARTFEPGMRRATILGTWQTAGINVTLVSNISDAEEVEGLFRQSKIVLNTHQTDTHHTLEDFRVLPALFQGAIVVSESSPFVHVVPYHQYIIFAKTADLAGTIKEVLKNYAYYHDIIHGPQSRLKEIFANMRRKARMDTETALLRVLCNRENSPLALSGYAGCDDVLLVDSVWKF